MPTSAIAYSDAELVETILRNLVDNALAYSRRGRVLVACRSQGEALCVEIWDQGIGISPDHQAQIFEDYFQVTNAQPSALGRAHVGLGLGIVMRLTRVLDHAIELRSEPGRGTVFRLHLPRGERLRARPAAAVSSHDGPLGDAFVVVIDNDDVILQAVEELLRAWGCRVITAGNATDAIARLADEPGVPGLLIVDYRLEGRLTGLDAATSLHEEYNTDIPVLLITAETDAMVLRAIECSGYMVLNKPITGDSLQDAVQLLLASS